MIKEDERIVVDTVDFQVSCRRFTVRATITRDRQLPVVDEFVLRLLAILDRMSINRMRGWFGFTASEMQTVLKDMGRRNLVEIVNDDIQLAPAGRELFRASSTTGVPHVVETSPIIENVWYDLVSRNMVPRSRARSADYLVKVAELPEAREMPEAFARSAFEENFRDYAKRIRRFPDPDSVNLYSVSDVEGGMYGYQTLRSDLVLEMERLRVRPIFKELDDSTANYNKLTVAASDAWQMQVGPDVASNTAAEFDRMTGDNRFTNVIENPQNIDIWRQALASITAEGSEFHASTGALYLQRNFDRLIANIGDFESKQADCDVVWLRPGGATWGRTLKIGETIASVGHALSNAGKKMRTTLAMPRSTHKTMRQNHKRIFERGLLLPQGHLPGNLEIFLVPGKLAVVNVHLPVGTHSVPIGGTVFNKKRLARITERLTRGNMEGWETLWENPAPNGVSGRPANVEAMEL
ncbi:hypothetical protein [Agrobacterium tumefaciens]|uniref:hypothetical protein n=1 Tax=Agrobacterium tumefaciens TaxID=358 RepID=UPI0028562593|nr:hypothetical protein [Agrobacterium tumefaciens]MDR6591563.1 hypothetical protein [Agrobacterium tumefaciens]